MASKVRKAVQKAASSAKSAAAKLSGKAPTAPPVIRGLPDGIVAVRNVTLPTLVLNVENEPRYLHIRSAMEQGNTAIVKREKEADGKPREPATVCDVTDMQTGQEFRWIVPAVVKSNLAEHYPDNGYVGKCFAVTFIGKRAGKRYKDFSVVEVARA